MGREARETNIIPSEAAFAPAIIADEKPTYHSLYSNAIQSARRGFSRPASVNFVAAIPYFP
jgi:hypothetical protein